MGPSPWFRKSLSGLQLPTLQGSPPTPALAEASTSNFPLPDPPSYWLPDCFAGSREIAFKPLGSRLLTAAVGGAEKEEAEEEVAGCAQQFLEPSQYLELTILSCFF